LLPSGGIGMSRWVPRAAALFVTSVLLLSACGGGRSSTDGGSSDTTTKTSTDSGVPQFGDLASPCSPGNPSGTPDKSVDASTVTIGYGDDAGYTAAAGLGHEASDAMKAMISWCNEQGGINGRTVVGKYYDAKITETANIMTEACSQTFMLVGQFFALPEGAEQTRIECGLPTVPGVVSGGAIAMAPLSVASYPQPIDYYNVGSAAQIARAFPDKVKKAATMLAIFPNLTDYGQRFVRTVPSVGWNFVGCDQTYPITGVSDYRPYVQKLKDCGVETVFILDLQAGMENILDAANQLDYHPIWLDAASVYTQDLAAWNANGNGDNLYFGNSFVPLDHTPEGSANAAYSSIVKANGGDISYSGQVSTSSFLLWATAAKACGNDLTRDCVMTNLKATHQWNAGGLSTDQDPGANLTDHCTQVMKLDGTKFVQWQPSEQGQFTCESSWATKVEPPIDSFTTLEVGADRLAHNVTG
jgi:ABC-type branched-subunit amino acid transport system substrate-binding protein